MGQQGSFVYVLPTTPILFNPHPPYIPTKEWSHSTWFSPNCTGDKYCLWEHASGKPPRPRAHSPSSVRFSVWMVGWVGGWVGLGKKKNGNSRGQFTDPPTFPPTHTLPSSPTPYLLILLLDAVGAGGSPAGCPGGGEGGATGAMPSSSSSARIDIHAVFELGGGGAGAPPRLVLRVVDHGVVRGEGHRVVVCERVSLSTFLHLCCCFAPWRPSPDPIAYA